MDLTAIGRRIKAAREVKGLTQEALAELVNFKTHAYLETAGFKPVSYTHLDVYKRQQQW